MRTHAHFLGAILAATAAHATDVNVIGLFPGKAVITVNRGAPRTISVGEKTSEGVALISSDSKGAVLEIDGKRQTLEMGQHFESATQTGERRSVNIPPDSRGHYFVDGQVNGGHVRFFVDTGATTVAIPLSDAVRLGIDYSKGSLHNVQTANGMITVYGVLLDSVSVGDITLYNVEGVIMPNPGAGPLLGMSFLNRTEIRREGQNLTLTKRY